MSPIFFGFEPKARGVTKRAVKTSVGDLEPVEPSRFHVYAFSVFNPLYSIIVSCLGLAVSIFSYPTGFYIPLTAQGLTVKSAGNNHLPFRAPGLAVIVARGKSLNTEVVTTLEGRGFTSLMMAQKTVWLKEEADRTDFLFAQDLEDVDTSGIAPGRYLTIDSFRQFLLVRSLTTRICEFFHHLADSGSKYEVATQIGNSKGKEPWIDAMIYPDAEVPMVTDAFEFVKSTSYKTESKCDQGYADIVKIAGSSDGLSCFNSGVMKSPSSRKEGAFSINDLGANIKTPGLLFKFDQRLASPDVNLIGDVIGRNFLAALGDTVKDQFDALHDLKRGLSALQLTRTGDELTHLYKCIEIAIDCKAGCVPIFSHSRYEGAFVGGGPGATITHSGRNFPFLPVETLKQEYLTLSDHVSNLSAIMKLVPFGGDDESEDGEIQEVTSMVQLRQFCLNTAIDQLSKDEIIRRAAHLDFGQQSWVINPANIKAAMDLICNPSSLSPKHPIGRLSLFSTDPVLVALSCFGEKTCPSWDIPNGTICSLKKSTVPPSPPQTDRKKGSSGFISDAAWVMVVRQTDLVSATDEFREMATTLQYRSTSSALAKKVGHRVFNRDRMGEFWKELRSALRTVNPSAVYEEEGGATSKRSRESTETVGSPVEKKRRRRMEV